MIWAVFYGLYCTALHLSVQIHFFVDVVLLLIHAAFHGSDIDPPRGHPALQLVVGPGVLPNPPEGQLPFFLAQRYIENTTTSECNRED